MFIPLSITDEIPSVFSDKKLEADKTYFGAYSLPLDYRKYGFRVELAIEFSDHIGLTIQTGFSNIKQKTTGLMSLSNGNYESSKPTESLYGQ